MNKVDWEINIDDLASRVAEKFGGDVVASVFQRVGATCFEDLNPEYYEEVFSDLMLMDEDD